MWPFKKRIPKYIRQQIEEREKRQKLAEECPYYVEPQYTSVTYTELIAAGIDSVMQELAGLKVPKVFEDAFKDD